MKFHIHAVPRFSTEHLPSDMLTKGKWFMQRSVGCFAPKKNGKIELFTVSFLT